MDNFVAIDVETANNHSTSICAIGAIKVQNGIITDRFYELVRPYPNFYFRYFTENIHGLCHSDTDQAPTFDRIWPQLQQFIDRLPLVAHNRQFDEGCLRATAKFYGIEWPYETFLCTLVRARSVIPRTLCASFSLPALADFLGIPFNNHHNALADAEACAKIAMTLL